MKRNVLILFSILLLAAIGIALLTTLPDKTAASATPTPTSPTKTPAPPFPLDMTICEVENSLLYMICPKGWEIRQAPLENGIAFEIAPAAPDKQVVTIYGTIQQVLPEEATPENLADMHAATFFTTGLAYTYTLVGDPIIDNNTADIIYLYTQAEATLSTGEQTSWMLGSALTNQTIATFAIGLPDSAIDEYGQMAMDMFNSIELNIELAAELGE